MRSLMPVLVSVLILLSVMFLGAGCRPVRALPALAVTLSKSDDRAQVAWEGDTAVVEIVSPSGIGSAHVAWDAEGPGATLLLRLHLNGLEGLEVSNGARQAALAVDNAPPYVVRAEDEAQEIDVARGDGVFAVRLGRSWLQNQGVDVRWVDFYR